MKRAYMDYVLGLIRQGVFQIDEEGQIWRHAVLHNGRRRGIGTSHMRQITPRRAEGVRRGYLILAMKMPDGQNDAVKAHSLVWEWFHGPIPDGMQIVHKDRNQHNNRLDNLELVEGTRMWRPGSPAMTEQQRKEIFSLHEQGKSYRVISEQTGYSKHYIARICEPEW